MISWEEINRLALLGTDRSDLDISFRQKLAKLGIETNGTPTELILEGAAILNQLRKAGFPLNKYEGLLPTIAAEDNAKVCSYKSAQHLRLILEGKFELALEEFVTHLLKNQKRLSPDSLPILFDQCLKRPALWKKLKPAIGAKGEWLLLQNPDWLSLTTNANIDQWEVGSKEERFGIIRYLRNHQPEKAIELLQVTWPQEHFKEKLAFLKIFDTGLSKVDEVFLEACLSDKRKEIRIQAATLLAMMPDSTLIERLFEQAKSCLKLNEQGIQIDLPNELPEITKRDGIFPNPKTAISKSLKGSWLEEILARIPPQKWENHFQKEPAALIKLIYDSDWEKLLITSLGRAALAFKSINWLEAIIRYWQKTDAEISWKSKTGKQIMQNLSPETFNQIAVAYLKNYGPLLEENSLVCQMMLLGVHSWDDKLSMLTIKGFQNWMSDATTYYWNTWHYRDLLKVAAYKVNPNLFDSLKTGWAFKSKIWHQWAKEVEYFLNVLNFRREMIKELKG